MTVFITASLKSSGDHLRQKFNKKVLHDNFIEINLPLKSFPEDVLHDLANIFFWKVLQKTHALKSKQNQNT